jgi:hypothetical protein
MGLLQKASLIITPNSYKEGKLYSAVPADGTGDMDVVRATTATRVNSAGLIEVVPRNLIANSQVLNVAYWTKDLTTVIDNNTTAPNGTTTAAKLTEAVGTGSHHIHNASGSFTPIVGASYSMSCFVKLPSTAAGRFVQLPFFIAGFGSNAYVNFDLLNGVVGTIGSSITSSSITNIGDGWYRIAASALATATGSSGFQLSFITSSSSARTESYTVTAGSEKAIFLYGLQIEAGAATEYFPTTTRLNIPRIDYTNGSCPSLLVEGQRTNLTLYSEQFDNAYWIKDIDVTVNSNVSISPSGNLDADRVNFASNNKAIYKNITATGAHRFSIYLKGEGLNIGKQIQLLIGNVGGTVNVTLTSQWQRFTADASTSTYVGVAKIGALQADSVLIWGSQLEVGAYSTSYIPTVASSVTRNTEFLTRAGFGNTSTSGTLFFDINVKNIASPNGFYLLQLFAGSTIGGASFSDANSTSIVANGPVIELYNNGYTRKIQTITPTSNQRVKMAIRYNGTNVSSAINGTLSSVFTDTSVGVKNAFRINNAESGAYSFNSVMFFPSYLSDSELQSLTTI